MRYFNTEGPVEREEHYLTPPPERVDLDGILTLIADKSYFVLHALQGPGPRGLRRLRQTVALCRLLGSKSIVNPFSRAFTMV